MLESLQSDQIRIHSVGRAQVVLQSNKGRESETSTTNITSQCETYHEDRVRMVVALSLSGHTNNAQMGEGTLVKQDMNTRHKNNQFEHNSIVCHAHPGGIALSLFLSI